MQTPQHNPKIDREWRTTLLLAGVIALFCGNRGRRGGALFLKPTDLVSLLEALHCVRRTQLVPEFLDSSPDPP